MLNYRYISSLKRHMLDYASARRDVIKQSGDALHLAKRAIFAMHRGDTAEATNKLAEAKRILKGLEKKHRRRDGISDEGSLRAALEEYVEAWLLMQCLSGKKIGEIPELSVEPEVYLAGLCDVPGELYRHAVRSATEGNMAELKRAAALADAIIGVLIEFDFTKYLRTKFDQAKQAAGKLEHVVYEVSLRK